MKLLMTMQALDIDDPVLGVYHEWAKALAQNVETLTVICLKEGRHELPRNVRVYSLGKEGGRTSRAAYAARFLALAWRLRSDYEAVFVHMNEEYALIAGWLWAALGKRVYLWRNHYAGSVLTDIAAAFCTNTFCTSVHSYTAKYSKNRIMPVGVDTERFYETDAPRTPRSILFLARMAPSKRPDVLVDALVALHERGVAFTASFYGSPLLVYNEYYAELRARAAPLGDLAQFHPGVKNSDTPELYRTHAVFVNCSPSGMLDKTLFEAAACGASVLAASDDFAVRAGESVHFTDAASLGQALEGALSAPSGQFTAIAEGESLRSLAATLARSMGTPY